MINFETKEGVKMSVNGITGASDAYSTYSAASKTAQTKASEKAVCLRLQVLPLSPPDFR